MKTKEWVKCDKCPKCKKTMNLIYNDFFVPFSKPEIRGQYCKNKKCSQYGIEKIHNRQNEQFTEKEYKLYKKVDWR